MHPQLSPMTNTPPQPSPEITILDTTRDHIQELLETMREADKREITSYGFTHARGLWRSYKHGLMNRTMLIDGKVACCWGVGGVYMGEVGTPWLLTSYEVEKISPLKFARTYQREVHKMLKLFPKLVNYCAADYDEAIRLLQICGFTIGEPEKMGNGLFRRFWRDA